MANPWDPLPREAKGDPGNLQLFAAVGAALSAWEIMESNLAYVFAFLCDTEAEAAARAYGVVSSFNGRRDMLGEAFRCYPKRDRPEVSHFPKLLERIKQFSARRNEIAHGITTLVRTGDEVSEGFYLCPAMYNSRKRLSRAAKREIGSDPVALGWSFLGKYAYTSAQVRHYREAFVDLADEVMDVARALVKLRGEGVKK